MAFLYKSEPNRGAVWQRRFAEQVPDLAFRIWPDAGDPAEVRYVAAWQPPDDLHRYANLRVLFSVGAGVDQLDLSRVPPGVQVVRMIEPGLVAGMVEYVTMAVLALHRGVPDYLMRQRRGVWQADPVRLASQTPVGVMGLGLLGTAVLERLAVFGFPLHGWSRSPRAMAGVATYAGRAALPEFLAASSILVCLLPLTPDTAGILDRRLFEALPDRASLVHAGRGGHLVADDLLDALASGRLRAAVLDVTDPEPLPPGHPIWGHERIWLTPHVASATQAESGAEAIIANIRRDRCGAPLAGLVDRERGY